MLDVSDIPKRRYRGYIPDAIVETCKMIFGSRFSGISGAIVSEGLLINWIEKSIREIEAQRVFTRATCAITRVTRYSE